MLSPLEIQILLKIQFLEIQILLKIIFLEIQLQLQVHVQLVTNATLVANLQVICN